MELPWSSYLYVVATLAMTFVGFCAIVISLHQTRKKSPNIQILRIHTRGYIELGFSSVGVAMLAPLLAACGLSASLAWRWSSVIIAVALTAHVSCPEKVLRACKGASPNAYLGGPSNYRIG